MKLSEQTLRVLTNFSRINQSLVFAVGNRLRTISTTDALIAEAVIPDSFPTRFAVYDLPQLLAATKLFDNPELDFDKTWLIIKDVNRSVKFFYTNEALVKAAPEADINVESGNYIKVQLKGADLSAMLKAVGILQVPQIIFKSDGGDVFIAALDLKNDSSNNFKINLGKGNGDVFQFAFDVEKIMLFAVDDYDVTLSDIGAAKFESSTIDLRYWSAVEAKGSFYNE